MANDEEDKKPRTEEEILLELAELVKVPQPQIKEGESASTFDGEVWNKPKEPKQEPKFGSLEWHKRRAAAKHEQTPIGPRSELAKEVRDRLGRVGLKLNMPNEHQAEEWAGRWLRRLLPEAVANVAEALRSEDPARRERASMAVLRANGLDKKEAVQGGGNSTIIVQMNGGAADSLPWLQRAVGKKGDDK